MFNSINMFNKPLCHAVRAKEVYEFVSLDSCNILHLFHRGCTI